jgi:hypothetical protein
MPQPGLAQGAVTYPAMMPHLPSLQQPATVYPARMPHLPSLRQANVVYPARMPHLPSLRGLGLTPAQQQGYFLDVADEVVDPKSIDSSTLSELIAAGMAAYAETGNTTVGKAVMMLQAEKSRRRVGRGMCAALAVGAAVLGAGVAYMMR